MKECLTLFCCPTPEFEAQNQDETCFAYFKALLQQNESLGWNAGLNGVRDAVWTFFSDKDLNLKLKPTAHVFQGDSQWAGQEVYSVASMSTIALIGACVYSRYGLNKPFPTVDVLATITSAGAAILAWDHGQVLGQTIFQNMGYTVAQSGYGSSFFAGLFEGPTQFILFKFIKLMADSREYTQFQHDPNSYLCDFSAGMGLSATLGIIPGAVWQIVYNALVIANANAVLASIAVMAPVLICNYGYAKLVDKLLGSDCYKASCFELCGRRQPEMIAEETAAPCVRLFHFFTSPCCGDDDAVNNAALADQAVSLASHGCSDRME